MTVKLAYQLSRTLIHLHSYKIMYGVETLAADILLVNLSQHYLYIWENQVEQLV